MLGDLLLLTTYEMDSDNRWCPLFIKLIDLRPHMAMAAYESLQQRIVVSFDLEELGLKGITRGDRRGPNGDGRAPA